MNKCEKCVNRIGCFVRDCDQICSTCGQKESCFVNDSETKEHCKKYEEDTIVFSWQEEKETPSCDNCSEKDFCSIHTEFLYYTTSREYEDFMEKDKSDCPQYKEVIYA